MNDYLVVLVTAPSNAEARRLARRLLTKKQAASVNFVPVDTMFAMSGAIQEEEEVMMVIKTHADSFEDLMSTIKAFHTSDTPEIIAMPVVMGSIEYLDWISNETRP